MHIVILTKNEWQAFGLVLEVARQMNFSRDHLLVWDDESEPAWSEQMRAFIGSLPNARFLVHPVNQHLGNHRNAVKAVIPENEWILQLDADEWILPGFIDACACEMAKHPNIDALFFERWNSYWEDTGTAVPEEPNYGELWKPDFQGRALRNIKQIIFDGQIHHGLRFADWPVYLRGRPFTIIHHRRREPRRYDSWKPQ